jgi:RimJ/RimL family protein N-acetyltransferase
VAKMNYKLVPYTDDYYQFVYDLKKTVYRQYVEECWGEWNEAVQKEMFDRFIDSVKEDTHLIFSQGQVIGFYNGTTLDDGSYEIGNICITPEYQNRGLGTQVLRDVLAVHKAKDIHIQYFKQNPVGRLYERLGFVPDGENDFHYVMKRFGETD